MRQLKLDQSKANYQVAYGRRIRGERSRRRRRLLGRASIFLLIAGGLVALGYSAYQTGTALARSQVSGLSREVTDLTGQLDASRSRNEQLQSNLTAAKQANLVLQNRYDKDVPTAALAELLGGAEQRLSQGVPAARLAQALREATVTRACETRVARKRFAFQAGKANPDDSVALLDGLIQVSATIPSIAADPVKTATVVVEQAWGGEPVKLTGLPVRQDILVNNLLLHLTVEASPMAGFGVVSLSTCGRG